jgi:3-hydroxyacyl-CoA dehydrogenase
VRLEKEGREVPNLAREVLATSGQSFFKRERGRKMRYHPASRGFAPVEIPSNVILLSETRAGGRVVKEGPGVSLLDLDDGIACLELHSKMNTLCPEMADFFMEAISEAENNFRGLVVGSQAAYFSAGADLKALGDAISSGDRAGVERLLRSLQGMLTGLKFARAPVVAACQGLALGGGCELAMQCGRIQAAPELNMGLVELGVGLIPAGGGCREWIVRANDQADGNDEALYLFLRRAARMMSQGVVSSSARDAMKLGYLRPGDLITVNRDTLIFSAKQLAIQMAESGYQPRQPRTNLRVLGAAGLERFREAIEEGRKERSLTDHDAHVNLQLAYVLCGGNASAGTPVSENSLADLERGVFLSLLEEKKTQERIAHMLATGKTLRN